MFKIHLSDVAKAAVEKLIHEPPAGYRSLGCLTIFAIKRYDGAKLKAGHALYSITQYV